MFWAVRVELEHLQVEVKEWERIAVVDSLFFVFQVFCFYCIFYLYFVILIAVLSFFFP